MKTFYEIAVMIFTICAAIILVATYAPSNGYVSMASQAPTEIILIPTATTAPSATPTVQPTATVTPTMQATIAPTIAPTQAPPAATTQPVIAPTATPAGPTANRNANLRAGPGTNFDIAGSVGDGQPLNLVSQNAPGDWYQIDNKQWIAAFLVDNAVYGLPVVEVEQPVMEQQAPAVEVAPVAPVAPSALFWADTQTQVCNGLEWRITDVRRSKDVYFSGNARVASGEWVIVYMHIRNVGSGDAQPDKMVMGVNGESWNVRGTHGANYMQTGGLNNPFDWFNPGQEYGISTAWDIPVGESLTFTAYECGQSVYLGEWKDVQQGAVTAN